MMLNWRDLMGSKERIIKMIKTFITYYLAGWCVGLLILVTAQKAHCNTEAIRNIIKKEAIKQGLDPEVALAVAQLESGLDPRAVGPRQEIGLFQIRPEYSKINRIQLFDPKLNAKEGVRILLFYKTYCPTKKDFLWVQCFNQGLRNPKYPELLPYYKKFHSILTEL